MVKQSEAKHPMRSSPRQEPCLKMRAASRGIHRLRALNDVGPVMRMVMQSEAKHPMRSSPGQEPCLMVKAASRRIHRLRALNDEEVR
jgi:hypothetical protein